MREIISSHSLLSYYYPLLSTGQDTVKCTNPGCVFKALDNSKMAVHRETVHGDKVSRTPFSIRYFIQWMVVVENINFYIFFIIHLVLFIY